MALLATALSLSLMMGHCSAVPRPSSTPRDVSVPQVATDPGSASRMETAPALIPPEWSQHMSAPDLSAPMTFTFVLKSANYAGLTARMEGIAASHLPWLTEDELKGYIAPMSGSRAAVEIAMQQMAAKLVSTSPFEDKVTVNSTVAAISKYFAAEFYKFDVDGQEPTHRTLNYTIPATLAPFVSDIYPISTFGTVSPVHLVVSNTTSLPSHDSRGVLKSRAAPHGCTTSAVTSSCYRSLYGFNTYKPNADVVRGVRGIPAVGILGYIGQNFNPLDLAVWSSKYRTDAADYEMRVVTSDGATNNPTNPGVEAALDTQTVAGIIYPLPSVFYGVGPARPTGDVFLLTFQRALEMRSPRPQILCHPES